MKKNIISFKGILPIFIIIGILVLNIALYLSHNFRVDVPPFFDDDRIYLAALYRDIILENGSYNDWYSSATPYYFPDMALYFLSNSIVSNFYFDIPIYFTLISILFIYASFRIQQIFFTPLQSLYLTAFIFFIVYFLQRNTYVYVQFIPVFHFGAFLVALFGVSLILDLLKKSYTKIVLTIIFLISILTIASDSLFMIYFTLPSILALIILWVVKKIESKFLFSTSGLLLVSIPLGRGLDILIRTHHSNYEKAIRLSLEHLQQNIQRIIDIFSAHPYASSATLLIIVVFAVITFFSVRFSQLPHHYHSKTPILFLSLYLGFMTLGVLTAIALLYPQEIYIHYLVAVFVLPIVLAPALCKWFGCDRYKKSFNFTLFLIAILMIATLFVSAYQHLRQVTFYNQYYPPRIACIDRFIETTGVRYGVSGYWDSKSTSMLSHHSVQIAQYYYNLKPYLAVTTVRWYKKVYDFAIIHNNSLNKTKIIKRNGSPAKIFQCPDNTEILYYPNSLYLSSPIQLSVQDK